MSFCHRSAEQHFSWHELAPVHPNDAFEILNGVIALHLSWQDPDAAVDAG